MANGLYEVLGVAPTASTSEIKRAFRGIARQCHPDVAGDDPAAAARFKEAREAYEVLMDPERRDAYDNPPKPRKRRRGKGDGSFFRAAYRRASGRTEDSARGGEDGADPGLDDLFADFGYGGATSRHSHTARFQGRARHPPRRGRDITLDLDIPDTLALHGGRHTFHYARLGRQPGWSHEDGTDGVKPVRDAETIDVPPGTRHASVRRYPGLGDAGAWGGPPGDLVVRFRLVDTGSRPDPRGTSTSGGVASQGGAEKVVDISVVEALLGGRVSVETPKGRIAMSIPPCTSSGRVFRLKGKAASGGDLLVSVRIVVPSALDEASRALIEAYAKLNPDSPER